MNIEQLNKILQAKPSEEVYTAIMCAAVKGDKCVYISFSSLSGDSVNYLKVQGYVVEQYRNTEDEGYKISGWDWVSCTGGVHNEI